ncbi:TetR/AcrR family transcriptional regulator [Sphingomonas tabacisoli]|uniref:TetR/AcrR family transcriptional regulator n=1 Tax=Sphingomonas tabacisoli TaxID=2249466 RepID=A0ABW4I4Z4_9SPHN
MSTVLKQQDDTPGELAVETVSRRPQQGRSKASLERMLNTARELMVERGSEEFTLQEVSQRGKVSIGSIYLRFESKDNLVRAVIGNALEQIAAEEDAMLAGVKAKSRSLADFIPRYVEDYAEVLKENAPLLRLAMQRAEIDPQVSAPGKRSAFRSQEISTNAMLEYREEFGGDDHEIKANAAFQIIFSALARQLSLGSLRESVHDYNWELHKRELGRMALAYLKADI